MALEVAKEFMDFIGNLVERFGAKLAGGILILAGAVMILPVVFPAYIVYGAALVAVGLALIAFGQKLKKAGDTYIASEAEKRIVNPALPSSSLIPPIQREIDKKLAAPLGLSSLGPTAEGRATGDISLSPIPPEK